MVRILILSMCISLTGCGSLSKAQSNQDPKLSATLSNGDIHIVRRADITQNLPMKTLTVAANPAYAGATKKYQGFDFFEFLKSIDSQLNTTASFWIEVTTLDGWKAPAYSSELLRAGDALLAVKELKETLSSPISDDGLWSLVVTPKKTLYPGPFYLVWNDSGENPDVMPLQVASIKIYYSKPK